MQDFYYFCSMIRFERICLVLFLLFLSLQGTAETNYRSSESSYTYPLDEIIADIYRAATELGETDYEQLQTDLYALHDTPIDLNHTSDEELSQLLFLSSQQIDDILAYANRHPFESVYELKLIPSLADYEIRDLLPFVTITREPSPIQPIPYAREVFHYGKHEVLARVDARNIEHYDGSDPVYVQGRYRFDYQRRVTIGLQIKRPTGGYAQDLQYNGFLQLRDFGHVHTLTAGHFQASFGQGLVFAPVFHNGKTAYVNSVGMQTEGLRYYSSADGEGLQGAGATFRWQWGKQTRLDASALYSIKRANDSTLHHLVGANITFRHKCLQVELTAAENIWSDSIRPYRDAAYNEHYFRGRNQAVIGASVRYNYGWFDAFGEVATTQNYELTSRPHWGVGVLAGSRFYPASGVTLIALYRYYSPYFDNPLGYAFSETSRLGDENGGYLGFDITRVRRWRFSGYADVFRFSGPKYGIPVYPTIGYDALAETQYIRQTWLIGLRLRARQKGEPSTYSARAQFKWSNGMVSLRTTAEANMVNDPSAKEKGLLPVNYGYTIYQDVSYRPLNSLTLTARVQFFDAREWANRIYCYEHDVLYAYSNTAVYGFGGRGYVCLKWQIIRQLALYLRVSETLYARSWYADHHPEWPYSPKSNPQAPVPNRTDIHFLLRATL